MLGIKGFWWSHWSLVIISCATNCDLPVFHSSSQAWSCQNFPCISFQLTDRAWECRPVHPSTLQDLTASDDFPFKTFIPSPAWHGESSRGISMCCRESAAVLLGKAFAFSRCSTQQLSTPTKRKCQRVLLKQCGFNLRGVQDFKTTTQFLLQSFFFLVLSHCFVEENTFTPHV